MKIITYFLTALCGGIHGDAGCDALSQGLGGVGGRAGVSAERERERERVEGARGALL